MRYSLLLLVLMGNVLGHFDIDDSVLYRVDFPGYQDPKNTEIKPHDDGPTQDLFTEESETYTMVSRNKEKYECRIPRVKSPEVTAAQYTGPSALALMETMFAQQPCAYRLESYWTYELCHGRFLRQYHEERDGKELKVQEYSLGTFSKEMFEELSREEERDKENDITRHPPTKKIESMNMPYFELTMEGGTVCDLNQEPRRTRVLYICYPTGRNEIYQLKETSTCEYEVIVLTSVLCSHPAYKPIESSEHGIACRPVLPGSGPKPVDLVELEGESARLRSERMWEAHMRGGDRPGQVKIEIRPVDPGAEDAEDGEDSFFKMSKVKEGVWKENNRKPFKPLMDPEVVKEFLRGEYCLYGGSGWWKYEFCYGKKVDQYHQEDQNTRTVINLGRFDEKKHLQWIQDHPNKKPKSVENRKHVSHFYSDGELCDLTGKPRSIEVKLKCKKADSPSAVTLYLLEPKPCQYVLGVESPLVCDILPHADSETGLMPHGILDSVEEKGSINMDKLEESLKRSPLSATVGENEEEGDTEADIHSYIDAYIDMDAAIEDDLVDEEFTFDELERLAKLKERIKRKQSSFSETKTGTRTETRTETKTETRTETGREGRRATTTVREQSLVIDGVRTTVRQTLVDGVVASEERVEEPAEEALEKDEL